MPSDPKPPTKEPTTPEPPFQPTPIDPKEFLEDDTPPAPTSPPDPAPAETSVDPLPPNPEPSEQSPQDALVDLFAEEDPVPAPVSPTSTPDDDEGLPARLRQQLKEQKAEFEARQKELQSAADAYKAERDQVRNEMVISNPLLDEGVQRANEAMTTEIDRIARSLGDPAAARKFLEQAKTYADNYSGLGNIYDPGYDEKFAKFREDINRDFGDAAPTVLASMPRVEEMRSAMENAVQAANSTSVDTQRQRQMQSHQEATALFQAAVDKTLVYSDELTKIEPYAAQNVVATMMEKIPHFKEISDKTIPRLKEALLPPKPILPEDAPSLSAEERNLKEQERYAAWQQQSNQIQQLIPLAFHAIPAVEVLARTLAETRKKLNALVGDSPQPVAPGAVSATPRVPVPEPDGTIRPITLEEIQE